jgi:predicted nucleotide-binding protein
MIGVVTTRRRRLVFLRRINDSQLSEKCHMNTIDELSKIAEAAAQLNGRVRDEAVQKPISALREACRQVGRAWSGSNMGYHATVYYEAFAPKPPEAQFSVEWGLEDRWPVHRPHPGWMIMDREDVFAELSSRAGCDPKTLDIEVAPIRDEFATIKENIISILIAVLSTRKDAFLERKLIEIEALNVRDPYTIGKGFISHGQVMTRDTLALGQGFSVAPHQILSALPMSMAELEAAIGALAKASQVCAVHLARIEERRPHVATKPSSTTFIGHGRSLVWRELKDFLVERLGLTVDEFNAVATAGIPTADRLAEMLDAAAFAFLIMTAEDEQSDGKLRARENVVHEAGLFQGRLGFKKAIILFEEGCEEFSNIHGLGQIRFPRGNIAAKFEEIRRVLERERVIASGHGGE